MAKIYIPLRASKRDSFFKGTVQPIVRGVKLYTIPKLLSKHIVALLYF
jgi:hypothetical protein